MKTLLIITFYLISGSVHCSDVIGYPGGRLILDFKHSINMSSPYFCKFRTQTKKCEDLIRPHGIQLLTGVYEERFTLFTSSEFITLIFRNLSLQDAGVYQGGETGVWSQNITLKVNRDPCCNETKTLRGYLGQTVRISCSYPVEFKTYIKSFYKLEHLSETEVIRTRGSEQHQDGRFSISDDTRNKEFSVNISDVREDDGGVYSCAVSNEGTEVSYHSLFSGLQLQVTAGYSIIITITVCVCVILVLMIGACVFFYKLRNNQAQVSASTSQRTETNDLPADYENDQPQIQNITIYNVYHSRYSSINQSDSVYQTLYLNTNQSDSIYQILNQHSDRSDSVYQSLDPTTNQQDSGYQTLNPNPNQRDSVYQALNPNTNQPDLVYQSLYLNPNQSDSFYQRLDVNSNQSASVYQSLDPSINKSDSVYQTLNSNTDQSDSVYQSLDPDTNQIQSIRP